MGAGITGAGLIPSRAFSSVSGGRTVNIGTASDENALLGLFVYDPVEVNKTDPLVDVTNNFSETLTVTVALNDCTQGSLESPSGDTGCSAQAAVDPGNTGTWQITTDNQVADGTTISFDVSGTGATTEVTAPGRSTTAQKNVTSAVNIKKFQLEKGNNPPAVDTTNDQFNVKQIRIVDNDNDGDITRRKFTVKDGNGDTVSLNDSQDDTDLTFAATADYTESAITLQADENLAANETYTIKLTGYDSDGNRDSAKRTP